MLIDSGHADNTTFFYRKLSVDQNITLNIETKYLKLETSTDKNSVQKSIELFWYTSQ